MSSSFQPPQNANYAATVVSLKDFVDLPNCDNVKAALIFGNSVIISKDAKVGDIGLFFPVETALSTEFCGNNNLFRKPEFGNVDPAQKGFFEQHGRVKCMKFRGHKSEGFYIPLSSLAFLDVIPNVQVGDTFDTLDGIEICRKYVPRGQHKPHSGQQKGRTAKLEDSIVDGQFRFHFDTENLRRNIHKVSPTDWISISDKWHGTSVVIAKVLVKRELAWYERLLKRLGIQIMDSQYGLTYSSRRVIKAVNGVTKEANHFYTEDIWGIVAKEVESKIPDGFTLYGEIVGYTPDGSPIQTGYAYGCPVGGHRFVVYRVTLTTPAGQVIELSWQQLTEFCEKYGFEMVPTFFVGQAEGLCCFSPSDPTDWSGVLLQDLEKEYIRDQDCPHNPGLPAEGIVLRIDRLHEAEAYKLKSFRFLKRESDELDKGVLDTETAESEEYVPVSNA